LNSPPPKEIFLFLTKLLKNEKITLESKEDLVALIKSCYPDIRSMINALQMNVVNGKIEHINIENISTIYEEIFKSLKNQDLDNIRKILRSNMIMYPELYQYLFDKVGEFKSPGNCIIEIGNALYRDAVISIREIGFITMCAKMLRGGYV
jgi:DNA polymerase III delta prime subunit